MDRLARDGVLFSNNFVTTSICAVSRASIFTGLYASCHGIHDFQTSMSEDQYAASYPVMMREAGYRTGFIGKYGVGRAMPAERYDYFKGFSGFGKYRNEVDGKHVHLTRIIGDQAIEFLEGCTDDQPFCLSISFKAPHVQDGVAPYFINDSAYDDLYRDATFPRVQKSDPRFFDELPDFIKNSASRRRWERRFATPELWQESVKRYHRLIHGVDVQLGRMLERLGESRLLGNTVVILTSDNGFYLGERGLAGKWYMHEESIRTPLIIRDPQMEKTRGTRRSEMTLNIDIAPTILSLAGLNIPPSVNGRSLLPLVAGESPPWRTEWFYEHLVNSPGIPKSEGVRTERWKYTRFIDRDPVYEWLYDLESDPEEERNLTTSSEHRRQLQHLRDRCQVWKQSLQAWQMDEHWQEPQ